MYNLNVCHWYKLLCIDFPELEKVLITEGSFYCNVFSQIQNQTVYRFNKNIKTLEFASNMCNAVDMSELDLSKYPSLESLFIGDNSFNYVSNITISNNNNLRTISVGENSFTNFQNSYGNTTEKSLTIRNCSLLHTISFGRYSFSDFNHFTLER